MRTHITPRWAIGAGAAVVALFLASCADDEPTATNGSNTESVAVESAPEESLDGADAAQATDDGTDTTDETSDEAADDEAAEVDDEVVDEVVDEVADDADPAAVTVVESAGSINTTSESYSLADEEFGTMVTVTVGEATRLIETNALPDHETGEFPNSGNPNEISEQDLTWEFSLTPTFVGDATQVRTSGVAVNGVKFEPGTAETLTCASGETYRIEALQDVYDLGLDFNNAHVQPTGEYHYHGISELLVDAYSTDDDLVHVGFAADGFLMYYSKSGAYASSYVLSDEARTGTDCVASGPDGSSTDVEGTVADGTYGSDYSFIEGAGDLDSCNGITIDGEYVYIVTDEYPYVTRCLNGEVTGDAVGGPPPGGAGEGADEGAGGPGPGGPPPGGAPQG